MRRKALNLCVFLTALFCVLGLGACGGVPVITFSESMPTQIDCNETFDLSDYVSVSDGQQLSLKAKYKDAAGLEHDYLTAGLTFKPTQPGKVTITVYLTGNREVSVSRELTVLEPLPSIVAGTEVNSYHVNETFVFSDFEDVVVYSSLTEVTFTAKRMEGNGETVEFTDETSFTFENVGKYTLYFEAENGRGKVDASIVFNVSMNLTENETEDITNNIKQGSGSPIKFNFIQESRTNASGKKSDWYWELESSPLAIWNESERNPDFDMYYVDILLPRVINLQESYITLDLNRNANCRNSVTMYYMTPGGTGLIDPPLGMGLKDSGAWYTYSSYNVNRTDTAVGAFRIMIHHPVSTAENPVIYDKNDVRLLIDNLLIHDYTEADLYEFENDLTNAAKAGDPSTCNLEKVEKPGEIGWYYRMSAVKANTPADMVYMMIPTGHIDFENQYLKFDIRIPANVSGTLSYILFDEQNGFILGDNPPWKKFYINGVSDWQTVRFELPAEELAKVGDQKISYIRICINPKSNDLTPEQFYADFDNMSIETKTAADKAEKDDLTNSAKPSGGENSWQMVEKPEGGWYYEMKVASDVGMQDQMVYMHFYTGDIDFATQYLQFDIKFDENIVKDLSYILYDPSNAFILQGDWHRFSLAGFEVGEDGWRTVRFELPAFDATKTLSHIRIAINPGANATLDNFAACFDNMKIVDKTADELAEMEDLTNAATPGDPSVAALTKVDKTEGGWYYTLSALKDNTTADQVYMVVKTGHIDFANEFLQFDIRISDRISTKLTYILYDASGNRILTGDPWKQYFINRAEGWQTVKFWIPAEELAMVGEQKISSMRICVNPIDNTLTAAEFTADFDNMKIVTKTEADKAELSDLTNKNQPSGSLNTFNRVEKSGGGWYYEMKAAAGAALADESIHMYFLTGAINPAAQYLQFDLKITDAIRDISFTLFDTGKQQIGEEWYKYSVEGFEPDADGWRTVRLELPTFETTLSYIRIALNPSETATIDTYLACFDNMEVVDWTADELAEKDDLTNLAAPGDPDVVAWEKVEKTDGEPGWYYRLSAKQDNTPENMVYIVVSTGHIDFENQVLKFDIRIPAEVSGKMTYILYDESGNMILGEPAWKSYYINETTEWQSVRFELPAEELAKVGEQKLSSIRLCINPETNELTKEQFYAYFDNMAVVNKTAAEKAERGDLTNEAKPSGGLCTWNRIEKEEGGWYYEMKVSSAQGMVDQMVFMHFYTGHINFAAQYLQFDIKTGAGVNDLSYILYDTANQFILSGDWHRFSLAEFEAGEDGWRTVRFELPPFDTSKTLSHIRIAINPVSGAAQEDFWAYFDNMKIVDKSAEELAEKDDFSNNYTVFDPNDATVTRIDDPENGGWYQRQSGTNLTADPNAYSNVVIYDVAGIDFGTAYYKFDIRFGADAAKTIYYVFYDTNNQVVAQNGLHWVGDPVLGEGWQTVYLRKPELAGDLRLKSIRLAFFANAEAIAAQRTENLYIEINNFNAVEYAPGEWEDKSNFWAVPAFGTLSVERAEDAEGGYWKLTNMNPSNADKTNGCVHFWTGPVDFTTQKLTFEVNVGEYVSKSMQYVFVTQTGAGCGGWTAVDIAGEGWQTVTVEYGAAVENFYGFRLAIWPNADLTGTGNLASIGIRNLQIVNKA